jgi:hypothetical protein
MSRLAFLANTVLLTALGGVAAQQPVTPDAGDKTTPLLLKLVRERLAMNPETASKAVRIDSVRFVRGVLRLNGTISSTSQRAKVLEVLEQGRIAIEDEADVKIQRFDADGLFVSAAPPKRLPGEGQDASSPSVDGAPGTQSDAIAWEYGDQAFPTYFSSQADGGRFHRFHRHGFCSRGYCDDPDTNAFSMQPSSGGGHWWRH